MRGHTTRTHRFREGRTGEYGTTNDVGIAWTPTGAPVLLAVLTTKPADPAAPKDDPLVARTAALLAPALL